MGSVMIMFIEVEGLPAVVPGLRSWVWSREGFSRSRRRPSHHHHWLSVLDCG